MIAHLTDYPTYIRQMAFNPNQKSRTPNWLLITSEDRTLLADKVFRAFQARENRSVIMVRPATLGLHLNFRGFFIAGIK